MLFVFGKSDCLLFPNKIFPNQKPHMEFISKHDLNYIYLNCEKFYQLFIKEETIKKKKIISFGNSKRWSLNYFNFMSFKFCC